LALAPPRGQRLHGAIGERDQIHAIVVEQPNVAQGRGELACVVELGRRTVVHGAAGVDQQIDRQVRLFLEQLEDEPIHAQIDAPSMWRTSSPAL
jgi:hypothetical protein